MFKVRIKDTKLAYDIGSKFTNSLEQHHCCRSDVQVEKNH